MNESIMLISSSWHSARRHLAESHLDKRHLHCVGKMAEPLIWRTWVSITQGEAFTRCFSRHTLFSIKYLFSSGTSATCITLLNDYIQIKSAAEIMSGRRNLSYHRVVNPRPSNLISSGFGREAILTYSYCPSFWPANSIIPLQSTAYTLGYRRRWPRACRSVWVRYNPALLSLPHQLQHCSF